ncbi:transglutaminase domain-containing protein, partial [Chloroflexota bacterium]
MSKRILGPLIASIVILCSVAIFTTIAEDILDPLAFVNEGKNKGSLPGSILSPDKDRIYTDSREPEAKDLFYVSGAEHTLYLRCFSSSFYDGKVWNSKNMSEPEEYHNENIDYDISNSIYSLSDDITIIPIVEFAPGFIPVSLHTTQIRSSLPLSYYPEEALFYLNETGTDTYYFTADNYQFTESFLKQAGIINSPKCLQLPDNITQRTRDLSAEITRDYTSPYEKTIAIASYLRDNYNYDPAYDLPPRNYVESTDWFLFESKIGIYTHFSSAFVILARCSGIPARITSGYGISPTINRQTVNASQIICLPEVGFDEAGWITYGNLYSEDEIIFPSAVVIPTSTTIESIDNKIEKDKPFTVKGTVVAEEGMPVSGMPVKIWFCPSDVEKPSFNEVEPDVSHLIPVGFDYTNDDGIYIATCLLPSEMAAGEYQAIAHSLGKGPYLPSDSDPPITVQAPTAIILDGVLLGPLEYEIDNEVSISGRLIDATNSHSLPGLPIEIRINDQLIGTDTTDSVGYFSIPYTLSELGDYTISASFSGNEYYLATEVTANAMAILWTTITLDINSESKVNDEVNIQGKLSDRSNNPLSERTIMLEIIDNSLFYHPIKTKITTTTNQNGEYSLNHTFTESGDYDINAIYAGIDYVKPSSNWEAIRVYGPPTLALNISEDAEIDDTIDIQGNLHDEFYNNLANMTIDIMLDDKTNPPTLLGQPTTDTNGNFSLPHTFTTEGDYTIKALFNGSGYYPSTNTSSSIRISIPTSITIALPQESKIGAVSAIQGILKDVYGNPLPNQTIQIKSGDNTIVTLVDTAIDGTYTSDYTFTNSGDYVITATYAGTGYFQTSSDLSTIRVYGPPTLSLNVPENADINDTIDIQGNIHDEFHNNLANMTIDIMLDDMTNPPVLLGQPTTDTNGNFTLPHTFTTEGDYVIKTLFNGSGYYPATDASSSITILIPTSITVSLPQELKIDSETTIQGILKDVYDNPLPNHVIFLQNGGDHIATVLTAEDGTYTRNYTFRDSGDHTITATHACREYFQNHGDSPTIMGYFQTSGASSTIRVYGPPTLTLNIPANADINDTIDIKGNLSDEFGNNLANMTIDITLYDETNPPTLLGQPTTDNNGNFSLPHTFTTEGDYVILSFFNASGYHPLTNTSSSITISIPTSITIYLPQELKIDSETTIQGILKDVYDGLLENHEIYLTQEGLKITNVITDTYGYYTSDYTFTNSGDYLITATYPGTGYYKSSSASQTVRVYGPPTIVLNIPGTADINDTIDIKGNLRD